MKCNADTFHCFEGGVVGNVLDLWAAAQRLSIYDAAQDLFLRLNIPSPALTTSGAGNSEEETVAIESNNCTIP